MWAVSGAALPRPREACRIVVPCGRTLKLKREAPVSAGRRWFPTLGCGLRPRGGRKPHPKVIKRHDSHPTEAQPTRESGGTPRDRGCGGAQVRAWRQSLWTSGRSILAGTMGRAGAIDRREPGQATTGPGESRRAPANPGESRRVPASPGISCRRCAASAPRGTIPGLTLSDAAVRAGGLGCSPDGAPFSGRRFDTSDDGTYLLINDSYSYGTVRTCDVSGHR